MKHKAIYFLSIFALSLAGCAESQDVHEAAATSEPSHEEHTATWSYEGASGPEHWGDLEGDFGTCSTGSEQSPIALASAAADDVELPALEFAYGETAIDVSDTGHGFKATPDGTHTLRIGDDTYTLLQFHAHTPSEHTLNGESFPMEVHFVHQNEAGNLAVAGVLITVGEENAAYDAYAAQSAGSADAASSADLSALLPADQSYMTYAGSLTTPPCTEGVRWIVLSSPITLSQEQIDVFSAPHGVTNRPVQPIGERVVSM